MPSPGGDSTAGLGFKAKDLEYHYLSLRRHHSPMTLDWGLSFDTHKEGPQQLWTHFIPELEVFLASSTVEDRGISS